MFRLPIVRTVVIRLALLGVLPAWAALCGEAVAKQPATSPATSASSSTRGTVSASLMSSDRYLVGGMPDFSQFNLNLPLAGAYYCTPTAAASCLTWFDISGIDVVPDYWRDNPSNQNAHLGLIQYLGGIMGTDASGGTPNDAYIRGFRSYLNDLRFNKSGLRFGIEYEGTDGFNSLPSGMVSAKVSLDWLKRELTSGAAVTLQLDYGKKTSSQQLPTLQSAHTVTLKGFDHDALIIGDPGYGGTFRMGRDMDYPNDLVYDQFSDQTRAVVMAAVATYPIHDLPMIDPARLPLDTNRIPLPWPNVRLMPRGAGLEGAGTATSVPEPATLVLLATALAACLLWGRRRRNAVKAL